MATETKPMPFPVRALKGNWEVLLSSEIEPQVGEHEQWLRCQTLEEAVAAARIEVMRYEFLVEGRRGGRLAQRMRIAAAPFLTRRIRIGRQLLQLAERAELEHN